MADETRVDMIEVSVRGKTYQLTEKDYKSLVDFTAGAFKGYANAMANSINNIVKIHDKYKASADYRTNYLKAVSQFIVVKVGNITYPSDTLRAKALTAVSKFQSATRSGKMDSVKNTLPVAEETLNAYRDDMDRFLKEMRMSAKTTGTVLQVASAAGFVVLAAMGASVLVAGGATAATAAAISAGSVKFFEGEINLLGRIMMGEKEINPFEEIWKLQVDATTAMATSFLGGKLSNKVLGKMASGVSSKVARKISGKLFNEKTVAPILERFLEGSGESMCSSVLESAFKSIGKGAKEGKPPTFKDFEAAIFDLLIAGLAGGFIRNLSEYEGGIVVSLTKKLSVDVIPKRVAQKFGKDLRDVDPKNLVKLYDAVNNAVFSKAREIADTHVIATTDGSVAGRVLIAEGENKAAKDSSLQKFIDTEIVKVSKKLKIGVK